PSEPREQRVWQRGFAEPRDGRRVRARPQRAADHPAAMDARAVRGEAAAPVRAHQLDGLDDEAGLLADLAHQRRELRLARPRAPAPQLPAAPLAAPREQHRGFALHHALHELALLVAPTLRAPADDLEP